MKNLAVINLSVKWWPVLKVLEEHNYEAKIIMSTNVTHSIIKNQYSNDFIDIQKVSDGLFTREEAYKTDFFLTNHDYFKNHLNTLMNFINRNMFLRKKTYNDIILIIHEMVNYLYDKFSEIDFYLFLTTPHQISTYLTYLIALLTQKKVIILTPTNINPLYVIADKIDSQKTKPNIIDQNNIINKALSDYINQVQKNDDYNKNDLNYIDRRNSKLFNAIWLDVKRFYYKIKMVSSEKIKINIFFSIHLRLYRFYKTKKIRRIYDKLSIKANYEEKYVYFPLHYQPERTTLPEGGDYNNQLIAIKKVREVFGKEIKIYVKEHPATFYRRQGFYFRSERFYENIVSDHNTNLIAISEKSKSLIDYAFCTVSVNGTSVLEAYLRSKKSYFLGYPWFRNLTHLRLIDFNEKEMSDAMNNLLNPLDAFQLQNRYLIYGFDFFIKFEQSINYNNFEMSIVNALAVNILHYFEKN